MKTNDSTHPGAVAQSLCGMPDCCVCPRRTSRDSLANGRSIRVISIVPLSSSLSSTLKFCVTFQLEWYQTEMSRVQQRINPDGRTKARFPGSSNWSTCIAWWSLIVKSFHHYGIGCTSRGHYVAKVYWADMLRGCFNGLIRSINTNCTMKCLSNRHNFY